MKKTAVIIMILFTALTKAQYVSIPDTAFGSWLNQNGMSSCMTGNDIAGWQLDTSCPAVLADTSIAIGYPWSSFLASISGVQYFRNLKHLDCQSCHIQAIQSLPPVLEYFNCNLNFFLSALPPLPATLKYLICSGNSIAILGPLPDSLSYLDCSSNNMNFITDFPSSLDTIICFADSLTDLPSLPLSLIYLDCSSNQLGALPMLPAQLKYLSCGFNNLSTLGALPDSLIFLSCRNNILTYLPALSSSLSYLHCAVNLLDSIPTIPSSLTVLYCFYNNLTTIGPLPRTLTYLDCGDNNLVSITNIGDSMSYFWCFDNPNLHCLPPLGIVGNLEFLANTAITCLPNYPLDNIVMDSAPICTSPCYPLGLEGLSGSNLTIYPNPAFDKVQSNLLLATYKVILTDMTDRVIQVTVSDYEIDISALPSGVYTVYLQNSQESISRKVVIE